ncbi:MAG: hypothetical protein FJW95_02825 [Actinobacteria bacterium]|nr:hypothetical protein [Actinomycetota bacterium]
MTEPSLPDKLLAIDAAFSRARISHAFGGAIALGYYAEPRATIDIDCNVFGGVDDRGRVLRALGGIGVAVPADDPTLVRDGQARYWWGRTPVDLFFAHDPFHGAMARGVRRVPFRDAMIDVLGPEHLVVCKAVFDRRKDWLDIEQVLVGVGAFRADEVRRWLPRIVGTDDPRVERFEALCSTLLEP